MLHREDKPSRSQRAYRPCSCGIKRLQVCFAYLSDVEWSTANLSESQRQFGNSRWFTRGWTLQELLAPARMQFFDKTWQPMGTRAQLVDSSNTFSEIHREFLNDSREEFQKASIAMKMSWASKRETEREEDMAYCLFGIFDVTMDVRYGVGGRKEFQRL